MADWWKSINQEIERFRSLPRPAGRLAFLGPDGRLDYDLIDNYYEEPQPGLSTEKLLERKNRW